MHYTYTTLVSCLISNMKVLMTEIFFFLEMILKAWNRRVKLKTGHVTIFRNAHK